MRLKELRTKRGLSQSDLAKIFNVAQNTISQWERNVREPDWNTAEKIADFFQVSVDYLMGRDVSKQHVNDDEALEFLEELHKRPEMKTLFQVGRKATKEDIEVAVKIIEALKNKSRPEED